MYILDVNNIIKNAFYDHGFDNWKCNWPIASDVVISVSKVIIF